MRSECPYFQRITLFALAAFNQLAKFAILQMEDVSAVDAVKVEGVSITK
jgi:hypothetical protein